MLGKVAESSAVPKPKFFGCGVFVATAEPTIVAATATTMRARIKNCWRHSLRKRRHAHRTTARRAGAPPSSGRVSASGADETAVLIDAPFGLTSVSVERLES